MVEKNNEFDEHVAKKQNQIQNTETAQLMGIVFNFFIIKIEHQNRTSK